METDILKKILLSQLEASFSMLKQCIDHCAEKEWSEKHRDAPFSQVLFHTLFYTDYYLSSNKEDFFSQDFHKENGELFKDYEELENRPATEVYTKEEIKKYYDYCRNKILKTIKKENGESLNQTSAFRKDIKKLELYIDLIRHIQHHAAQLGLRLQLITGREMVWVTSG